VSYISDPDSYEANFKEKMVRRCLSQGAFYMKKGQSHLDEASLEFKRILFLDPENERARKNLDRINAERGKDKTVTVVASAHPTQKSRGEAQHKTDHKKPKEKKHKSVTVVAASGGKRRGRAGKVIGGLFAAAVLVTAGWFAYQRDMIPHSLGFLNQSGNRPPVLSAPKNMTVTSGERIAFELQAVDAEEDTVRFYSDELPRGAKLSETGEFKWRVDYNQTGTHKIKFYADDGTSASLSETVIEVQAAALNLNFTKIGDVSVDAGRRFASSLKAKSTSGKRVRFSLEKAPAGMTIAKGQLVWEPGADESGTHKAVVKATDGYITEKQTITLEVRSIAEQEAEMAQVQWNLPQTADVFVDGDLEQSGTRSVAVELPKGTHTLRADLMDGTTAWIETLELLPGESIKLEAPKLRFGELSVYFLGGVGEFRVNGRLYKAQPPFSGEKIPVGAHVVSCRMANEPKAKEFNILVEEGRETIIEYEVGSEPVITQDR
jgi:hypothetical protein